LKVNVASMLAGIVAPANVVSTPMTGLRSVVTELYPSERWPAAMAYWDSPVRTEALAGP